MLRSHDYHKSVAMDTGKWTMDESLIVKCVIVFDNNRNTQGVRAVSNYK